MPVQIGKPGGAVCNDILLPKGGMVSKSASNVFGLVAIIIFFDCDRRAGFNDSLGFFRWLKYKGAVTVRESLLVDVRR